MAYNFVTSDATLIVRQLIDEFERDTGITVAPASAEMILLRWFAARLVQERALLNWAASQNVPSRAEGVHLDALAELTYAASRPQAKPASVTMRFSISEAQSFTVTVPAGTRVTDAGKTKYWVLREDVMILPGDTFGEGMCDAETAGEDGNGYVPGQIDKCVDLYPYHSAVVNVTTSAGGSDTFSDDEFRALMRTSMAAYSTAGATDAYVYHAKRVSSAIGDVKAVRVQHLVEEEIPVYEHHAFLGGDTMLPETLMIEGGEPETDYTVSYEDGLLDIGLVSGGALYDAESLVVSIDQIDGGQVHIYALMADGYPADDDTKALILEACSDKTVRPLTDFVQVADPRVETYDIDITYYIPRGTDKPISQLLDDVDDAIDNYIGWQSAEMGRDINPQVLIQYLKEAGIKRVEVRSPVYTVLSNGLDGTVPQAAVLGEKTVINGGMEDM